jgi:methanesulfonate monooxygenase subunit beta
MTPARVSAETRLEASELVYRSALYLDEQRFGEWLDLTASAFRYRIKAHSPELKKRMTWLDHDRAGIAALIELLPKHHVNRAEWLRHVSVQLVTATSDTQLEVVSSLALFQTAIDAGDAHVDGGSSYLFAVGRYHDTVKLENERWLLAERTVVLQTRQLGLGSHAFP